MPSGPHWNTNGNPRYRDRGVCRTVVLGTRIDLRLLPYFDLRLLLLREWIIGTGWGARLVAVSVVAGVDTRRASASAATSVRNTLPVISSASASSPSPSPELGNIHFPGRILDVCNIVHIIRKVCRMVIKRIIGMHTPQVLVARPYVIAAPAAAFRVGPCPWGEAHVICDHTAGSVDFGDVDLARDRVVDECTGCGCGGDSRDVCEHPSVSAPDCMRPPRLPTRSRPPDQHFSPLD